MTPSNMKAQRIRIAFSKTGAMQYTGHLALRRAWERTFRRADLPLAYSSGHTPRPQMNLATPLPLGFLSSAELGDFWLEERIELAGIKGRLSKAAPPGIEIHAVQEIPRLHGEKLPSLVQAAAYAVTLPSQPPSIHRKIQSFLERESVIRTRKGKEYDLRPLVHELRYQALDDQQGEIQMTLSHLPGKTGRPDEVLSALGIEPNAGQIWRRQLYLKGQG